jgi:hypothetical protein
VTEPLKDAATGEQTTVPVGEVGDQLATGKVQPTPTTRVPVVVSDGSIQTIEAKDLQAALDQGWTVASSQQVAAFRDQQHYADVAGQTRAAGEAALRGLTVGLSDKGLRALGVSAEDLAKRRELNPVTSTVAELAGTVAPLVLSGGAAAPEEAAGLASMLSGAVRTAGAAPRAIAATGHAVERGLGSILGHRIAAKAVAGAGAGVVEGGLYGLGQAVSESALKDIPLSSERIAVHVGLGALLGGAAGGVLGTATASVEKMLVPKIKEMFTVENVQRFVDRAGLRQWAQGRGKAMFGRLRRDFGSDAEKVIGQTVRDEGLDQVIASGRSWDEIHGITTEKMGVAGRKIGEDLRAIDEALPDAAAPVTERVAARAEREVLEPLARSGVRSDKGIASKVKRELEWLWPQAEGATAEEIAAGVAAKRAEFVPSFERLHQLRARIDDIAFPKGMADATPYQKALQKMRGIVEDEITAGADAAAEKMGGISAATYSADKLRYKGLLWLNKAAESNAASELSNRTVSLTDNIWGSAITAGTLTRLLAGDVSALGAMTVATMAGVGAGALNKYLRQQGQDLAARTGQKVLALMRASESTAKTTDRAVGDFFAAGAQLETALHPVAHAVEKGAEQTAVVMHRTIDTVGTKLHEAREEQESLRSRFDTKIAQLDRFQQAPEAALGKPLGDTDQTAPAVSQQIREIANRGAAFLLSKAPKHRQRASQVQPQFDKRQHVSDSEMARFLRYSDAVENPKKLLKQFGKGQLRREGAETLRTVYPLTHRHLVESVQERLMKAKTPLPRQKLVQLSLLLGTPLHPSMEPGFIAMCQKIHQSARKQAEQAPQSAPKRSGPSAAAQYATSSQQIEARA